MLKSSAQMQLFATELEQKNTKNRIVIGIFKSLLEKADDDSLNKFYLN